MDYLFMYTQIHKQGRVLIPSAIRNNLQYQPGDHVVLRIINDELHVISLKKAVGDIQNSIKKYNKNNISLVDEFIAERRLEAKREV